MTENKKLLIGKWEFVKAEKYNDACWQSSDYTAGMFWEFHPDYISQTKTIGTIVETAPLVNFVKLNYIFSEVDNCLKIEIYTDPETRILDETDVYFLSQITQTSAQTTIVLDLINQISSHSPHLRYTLQQLRGRN
ncbi:MAG: hypothetical protein SNG38_05105 [Rikenellaceae bacterium]